jgi:tetratricopeptide (TPR) repeat protein
MAAVRNRLIPRSTLAPRRAGVACALSLLAVPSAAATREWVMVRSPGFVVVSDAGEKRAGQVAHQFEQVRGLFRQVLQARVDPGRLVMIFAVKDEDGLRELLPGRWERKGGVRPAGMFLPGRDKHLMALRLDAHTESPYHVLYHEYTHLLTRLNVRALPLWLTEGLAEFWGSSDIDEKEVRWGMLSQWHVLQLRRSSLLKLDELMAADQSSPLYNEAKRTSSFYAEAAVLTHYLLLGAPERRGQIQEFFKLLETDVEEPEALRRAFGDLRKLESELAAYVRRNTYPGIKAEARIDTQGIQVTPLTPAQSDALRGEFLARTGRPGEARPLLELALRHDPGLSSAHEGLGVLAWFEGQREDALRHFTEAARLAPANYVANFRAGLIEDQGADAAADFARREQALRGALQANPAFAPAWAALGRLLAERDDRRAEAISAAQRACALDPAAASHRVALWQTLRRAGQSAEATRVEEGLLQIARRDSDVLSEVTGELDQSDRSAEAEALLRKAHEMNPGNAMVTIIGADFLHRQGRKGEAEILLRGAVAADPQSQLLMGSLAWVLADSPGKAAEGLVLIDRVLHEAPDVPEFLDTRGWALFQLKRLAEAEAVLRSAIDRRARAEILEHLGDVLLEQGRAAEALAQYGRALAAPDVTPRLRAAVQSKIDGARPTPASPPP